MKKNRLYLALFAACLAGYIYTAVFYSKGADVYNSDTSVCFIKNTFHIPCPSCGSTRSVIALLHGDIGSALYWNPFGLILFMIMLVAPLWILYDIIKRRSSLLFFYSAVEDLLRKKRVLAPAVLLVAINWIWNIYKGL